MKKLTALCMALILLLGAGSAAATVNITQKLGEDVKLKVTAETKNAIIMTLRNEYDRDTFEFKSGKTDFGYWGKNGASLVRLDGKPLDGKLGDLTFKIDEEAIPGDYKISFRVVNAYDIMEEKAKVTVQDFKVTVEDTLIADEEKIRGYVGQCYRVFLNREAEEGGLDSWTQLLISRHVNASNLVRDMMDSEEFKARGVSMDDVVEMLYLSMLGRPSDAEGKAGWMDIVNAGCSENLVINGFGGSDEFKNLCADYGMRVGYVDDSEPRNANVLLTSFISRCYREGLGRTADIGGLNYWCDELLTDRMTAQEVAAGFVFSPEMNAAQKITEDPDALLDSLYRLYLGREADAAGKEYWKHRIAEGLPLEVLNEGFAMSVEFGDIVHSYGLD